MLRNPTRYSAVGARLPSGVLLVGPPGSGKLIYLPTAQHTYRNPAIGLRQDPAGACDGQRVQGPLLRLLRQ